MAGERNRIPVDKKYIHSLGLATFAFAGCGWQAVWCCEKMEPGILREFQSKEATAGTIAKKFVNLVRNMPPSKEREALALNAQEFLRLVSTRNKIVHGKPCTSPDGSQRLSSGGVIELSEVNDAADNFSSCGDKFNSQFYGFLKTT